MPSTQQKLSPTQRRYLKALVLAYNLLPPVGYFLLGWGFSTYVLSWVLPFAVAGLFHMVKLVRVFFHQARTEEVSVLLVVIIMAAYPFLVAGLAGMMAAMFGVALIMDANREHLFNAPLGLEAFELYGYALLLLFTAHRRYRLLFVKTREYERHRFQDYWYGDMRVGDLFFRLTVLALVSLGLFALGGLHPSDGPLGKVFSRSGGWFPTNHLFVVFFTVFSLKYDYAAFRKEVEPEQEPAPGVQEK